MSELRLRAASPAELLFVGHNPIGAVIAAAAGVGIVALAGRAEGVAATAGQPFGGFLAIACGSAALFRDSLRIDLVRRRLLRTRGYGPLATKTDRGLETISSVEVVEERGLRRGEPSVEWEVWLRSRPPAADLRVLETADEGGSSDVPRSNRQGARTVGPIAARSEGT